MIDEYLDREIRQARKEELALRVALSFSYKDDEDQHHEFNLDATAVQRIIARMVDRMFPEGGIPRITDKSTFEVVWAALDEMKERGEFSGDTRRTAEFIARGRPEPEPAKRSSVDL